MSRIHLTIDKLVLGGLDPAAREVFLARLKDELAVLLTDPASRAACARSHRTPVLRLDRGRLEPGTAGASKLGRQVAQGIARGLKP
jgi:hypothetical protein